MRRIEGGFEIPGVLWHRQPEGGALPLVLDSPHSGSLYPEDFFYCCPFPALRRAEDAYVDELFAAAPIHGASLIGALFPRSYLDPNRARDGTTCDAGFTEFVARFLRGLGYDVRVNEGYKGVEIVRRQGRPAQNRHSLQIEVDRSLYMDQKTLERLPGFDRLSADLGRLVEAIARYIRAQL